MLGDRWRLRRRSIQHGHFTAITLDWTETE
jgi:hypothetical protein